jgi:signal transduction histidine kinase
VIVVKNITSFKELDQAKTHFIATVSHELKTPLASSDFSLKLLEDARIGPLTPEQQDLVRQLKQDNARMLKILSELLNMTQIESGKIQLQVEPVQVQELIAASLQQVSQVLREKQVQVVQELDNLPVIRGDGDKIGWVLNNYLTNAIRYAPAGSTITVKAWMEQGRLSVSVRDEGPGIAPQYREKVFDRYFQVPGRKDGAGSGIGLAICREIMTAMGGTVWVNSQAGAGSAFGFTLGGR